MNRGVLVSPLPLQRVVLLLPRGHLLLLLLCLARLLLLLLLLPLFLLLLLLRPLLLLLCSCCCSCSCCWSCSYCSPSKPSPLIQNRSLSTGMISGGFAPIIPNMCLLLEDMRGCLIIKGLSD